MFTFSVYSLTVSLGMGYCLAKAYKTSVCRPTLYNHSLTLSLGVWGGEWLVIEIHTSRDIRVPDKRQFKNNIRNSLIEHIHSQPMLTPHTPRHAVGVGWREHCQKVCWKAMF